MEIVHIINLITRQDRLISVVNQSRWQKFPVMVWTGIEGNLTQAQNINEAHKQIVRWAKEKKMPRVIIAEDDIMFTGPTGFKYFLSQIPESYDLFLSMIYAGEVVENKMLNGFSGLTMYVVHERFYDFFLSIPDNVHIDRWLGQFAFEKEYFVCHPYVCKQTGGYSDNLRKDMNYQLFEEKMTFYID